jgi:hypothetical protein
MIVLLTAYLYEGLPPVGDDSEIRERKMEFWRDGCQSRTFIAVQRRPTNNDRCVPRLSL